MGFEDVLRAKQDYARKFPDPDVGQAATHENQGMSTEAGFVNTSKNAEAGFFAPHEFSFSSAPSMGYVSPGAVEAGHRRPEDADPQAEQQYLRDWYHDKTGAPSRGIMNR